MALPALVLEAFLNGISMRRIERLVQAMGIENISVSRVFEINRNLSGRSCRLALLPLDRRSL